MPPDGGPGFRGRRVRPASRLRATGVARDGAGPERVIPPGKHASASVDAAVPHRLVNRFRASWRSSISPRDFAPRPLRFSWRRARAAWRARTCSPARRNARGAAHPACKARVSHGHRVARFRCSLRATGRQPRACSVGTRRASALASPRRATRARDVHATRRAPGAVRVPPAPTGPPAPHGGRGIPGGRGARRMPAPHLRPPARASRCGNKASRDARESCRRRRAPARAGARAPGRVGTPARVGRRTAGRRRGRGTRARPPAVTTTWADRRARGSDARSWRGARGAVPRGPSS